jgi:hypothetical protein
MKIIFTLLFMIVSSNAAAAWTLVEGGGAVYVDLDNIHRNGSYLKVWTLANNEANEDVAASQRSLKTLREYACQSGTSRVLDVVMHEERMGKGKILLKRAMTDGTPLGPGEWEGTDESILKMVCGQKR